MKILVTGGAGYIGAVMVPRLLQAGHEVTVLDNFMYHQTALLDSCHYTSLRIVKGDTRDASLLERLVPEADAIFPLACLTGAPICDQRPQDAEEIIIDALADIIRLHRPGQRIVYPTTNSGYGVGEKGKHCTEETPLNPISLYGRLKVRAERMVLETGDGITLRLATAFGISPRMRLDLLVNDFTYKAVFDGHIELFEAHFMRNFIHVRDIAKAFQHALDNFDKMKDEPYNVGLSDANLSKKGLCEEIQKQVPTFTFSESSDAKDPDQRDYIVSNDKIEATGFRPDVTLAAGIAELIKGYTILPKVREVTTQLSNV
ncbi:MAG: NAD(P)-dependent oxidoreductase [Candidatus Omnitrophica bacterium]|nr:NAD(P)-dependent oxidoreductase [Candidatus Omnitrophota bacterium]